MQAQRQYSGPSADANSGPSVVDVIRASRLDRDLTPTRALMLVQVATYSNGCQGSCWASVATLAAAAHVAERTAQRALRELVEVGWLHELREVGRSTVYRVSAERVRHPHVDPGPLFSSVSAPERDDADQLPLFGGGVSQCHPRGVSVTPDQTTDQTIPDPPQPPRKRGGSTSPPEIDLEERPRPALPLETGDPERVEWVASFVAAELALVAEEQSVEAARSSAAQFARREGRIVDNLVALTRPIRAAGGRLVRRLPDAPDGLRRREIAAGMVVGARRWLGAVR